MKEERRKKKLSIASGFLAGGLITFVLASSGLSVDLPDIESGISNFFRVGFNFGIYFF